MTTINKLYPGKPDYVGPTEGWFTLLHHTGPLAEYSKNITERLYYIKNYKTTVEVPIRLRHIVYVPDNMIPERLKKALADWNKALADWDKSYVDWDKVRADLNNSSELLAYINQHVTDCRWNGKELKFE